MKKTLIIIIIISLIALPSCSVVKGVELSRRLIIEAIGIDKRDGVTAVTLQTLDTHSAGTGSDPSSGGDLVKLYVFTGRSVGEALSQVQSATGLTPLYSQARVLVLGMELAKDNISESVDFFLREYNARSDILIAVAEEEAYKIVSADLGSSVPDATIIEDALNYGSDNGFCYSVALYKFMNLVLSATDIAYCPIIGLEDSADPEIKEPKISGTAFFRYASLAFTADNEITRGCMFLTDSIKKTSVTVNGNEGLYTLEVISSATKIKTERNQSGYDFKINVKLKCDITEFVSGDFNSVGEKQALDAKDAGTKYFEELLKKSYNRIFDGEKADICRFCRRALLKYPKEADGFNKRLFDEGFVNTEIEVELTIRRTGKESV